MQQRLNGAMNECVHDVCTHIHRCQGIVLQASSPHCFASRPHSNTPSAPVAEAPAAAQKKEPTAAELKADKAAAKAAKNAARERQMAAVEAAAVAK